MLPSYPENAHVEHLSTRTHKTQLVRPPEIRSKQGNAWTKKIRAVCVKCNNGWMSRLETAAMPILKPLIATMPHTVYEESLQVLVRWITLKVMVAEHNQPNMAVASPEDRTKFKETVETPPNFKIWIGKCGIGGWETSFVRHTATITPPTEQIPDPNNVHTVTFGIGDLFVHVLHTREPLTLYELNTLGGEFLQIYPTRGPINWPPGKTLSAARAHMTAFMLDRLLAEPRVIWKPHPSYPDGK